MFRLASLAIALVAILFGSASAHAARPLVAVVAQNGGTETTDFLVPFGVLSRSGVAEVVAVATGPGPVELHPALTVELGATLASFDAAHPDGAAFVIVPAVMEPDSPALHAWLRAQAAHGATLVGICEGALVLAAAGLLDDRAATTHWYALDGAAKEFPRVQWTRDRRWVDAGPVITTTGVSASVPVSLALVERIGGAEAARALAAGMGVRDWSDAHETAAFALDAGAIWTAASSWLAFWNHERVGIPVGAGVDEISVALTADALARTWSATPVAIAADATVRTRYGLTLRAGSDRVDRSVALPTSDDSEVPVLDAILDRIAIDYGAATADFVALQLETLR